MTSTFHRMLTIARLITFAGGLLFTLTGFAKLTNRAAFEEAMVSHGVVPESFVSTLSMIFPLAEVAIGAMTLFAAVSCWHVRRAAQVLTLCMVLLTAYAVVLVVRPPIEPAPCACGFSGVPIESWRPVVYRNSAVGAIFLGACCLCRVRVASGPHRRPHATSGDHEHRDG